MRRRTERRRTDTYDAGRRLSLACAALLLVSMLPAGVSASVLTDLVASMDEKTWVQMPANGSLTGLNMESTLTTYANSGTWDAANDRMIWVGGPGGCCVSSPVYKIVTYDAPSDTWSLIATPYQEIGHASDGNAFNPNDGRLYFKLWYDGIKIWDGSDFSSMSIPFNEYGATALTYFPDANGGSGALIYVGIYGDLAAFDGNSWTTIDQGQNWGDIHVIAEYNPTHKVVWIGAGSGSSQTSYRMDANFNVTQLNDAPFSLNSSPSGSMQAADSVSGRYLIRNHTDNTWWEFDIINDNWSQITGMSGQPQLKNPIIIPIAELGVIMVLDNEFTSAAYLYKHSSSDADFIAPEKPTDLAVQ